MISQGTKQTLALSISESSLVSRTSIGKSIRRKSARASLPPKAQADEGGILIKTSVATVTAILNALNLRPRKRQVKETEPPISFADVKQRLQADYIEKQYFVTGDVDLGLYKRDCLFADPTISFRGREKYTNNLATLKAFFLGPNIELFSLEETQTSRRLRARWRLTVQLRLPWKPNIDIFGSTMYTLDPNSFQIIEHRESWEVSAWQAILQIFGVAKDT